MARPRIKDVAAKAGVSVPTVSNFLNRPESVHPMTRARVVAAIEELGFVRNDSARQLRAGVSLTVVYLGHGAGRAFFGGVARGVDDIVRANGLTLFLCDSGQELARETAYLDQLLEQRVRGVVLTPVDGGNVRIATLLAQGIPVVMVSPRRVSDCQDTCSVGVDEVAGGELAVTHVLKEGHRRIAFIGDTRDPAVRDRLDGVCRGLHIFGMGEGQAQCGGHGDEGPSCRA